MTNQTKLAMNLALVLSMTLASACVGQAAQRNERWAALNHIPPRRSSQIQNGPGGVNTSLPREPYLPWNRWWWTRMVDGGFKWVRIGQYEDSSDVTGWDWIEQKRGQFALPPQVDDFVDSLADNGANIELQLLYGNPMYTSPAGKLPGSILPAPGSVHNPDQGLYAIFWPPTTPEQIEAFNRYTTWMVAHFRGRVRYYSLWNEQDGSYWNPKPNAEEYGRLLKAFVPAVRQADPEAKIVYGGQASLSTMFARRALDACQCASGLDVFAYHTYPGGYAHNTPPESMDYGAFAELTPKALRAMVRDYPGIRPDIQFWDDEYNSLPFQEGSDESVQAKYVPRALVYNWAASVPTFLWELINDTNTSEGDRFGIIHGMMYKPADFAPRPVFHPLENTNALFSDTKPDPSVEIETSGFSDLSAAADAPFLTYGFRSSEGKAIVAFWLAAHSWPGGAEFVPYYVTMTLKNTGIKNPVLIDVLSGKIWPLEWKEGTAETLEKVPVRDSVLAIADETYFNWKVLPEAPSSLDATLSGGAAKLTWETHGGDPDGLLIERRLDHQGKWEQIAKLPARAREYTDARPPKSQRVSYRVRARSEAGNSAYSNIASVSF